MQWQPHQRMNSTSVGVYYFYSYLISSETIYGRKYSQEVEIFQLPLDLNIYNRQIELNNFRGVHLLQNINHGFIYLCQFILMHFHYHNFHFWTVSETLNNNVLWCQKSRLNVDSWCIQYLASQNAYTVIQISFVKVCSVSICGSLQKDLLHIEIEFY